MVTNGQSHIYSVTEEGNDADIRREFANIFTGLGKLKNYKLKLHVDETVQPIATLAIRFTREVESKTG